MADTEAEAGSREHAAAGKGWAHLLRNIAPRGDQAEMLAEYDQAKRLARASAHEYAQAVREAEA